MMFPELLCELTVTGVDLKDCGKQKNVCVMSSSDCLNTASDGTPDVLTSPENFVNTSCHFVKHEESFTCRWSQMSHVTTVNTFIISRENDIISCRSILNPYSSFDFVIKSVNVFSQREIFSHVSSVILDEIVQAPRPVITSVNSTDTSLNVSWTSKDVTVTKCQIRYRRLDTESWTESVVLDVCVEFVHIICDLQPFTEYSVSVCCCHESGQWSQWSSEARVMTSETMPRAAPQVSYYLALDRTSGSRQLWILWKALDPSDAGGIIQGYEVSVTRLSERRSVRTSDLKVCVPVVSEEYDITVTAYNRAGRSPYHQLRVSADHLQAVSVVEGLWVSSEGLSLRLHWIYDLTAVNVSEFAIEWRSSSKPSSGGWKRVNGCYSYALLSGIISEETYSISVYSIHGSLCGPPVSVSADLKHGTLMDLVSFRLVSVTKSCVTVKCVWRETEPSVHVLQYTLMIKGKHLSQYLTVFPHKEQNSFYNLQPNTQYTLYIHGQTTSGKVSKASLDVKTPLLDYDDIIKCCVPLVLLVLGFGIFSVVIKRACKEYFCSDVADPGYSQIGHWLLNAPRQANSKVCVLMLEDVFTVDQSEKNVIRVESRVSSDENVKMSSKGADETSDDEENSVRPSCPVDYVGLPVITADNLDYVPSSL
ncbi:interleukin-6 receptor subunit beta isoform X2 [Triplophysa dalaica]|uniref:interleukin-6 receptor subunit beta isoform X2 n=1 Tax=Triplophysa dalaica TaxID=1582913 RepID=UPI0024DFE828|nr:interleukin-6 receptor subunit beta isoform X2 [Triplophysa dalaica]